jgi:hypothetical protein
MRDGCTLPGLRVAFEGVTRYSLFFGAIDAVNRMTA